MYTLKIIAKLWLMVVLGTVVCALIGTILSGLFIVFINLWYVLIPVIVLIILRNK